LRDEILEPELHSKVAGHMCRSFPLACVWGKTGLVYPGSPRRIELSCRNYAPGIPTVEWAGGPI
jgi:hypothetical protein